MIGTYSHQGSQVSSMGCYDQEILTVDASVHTLTAAKAGLCGYAWVRLMGCDARVTADSTHSPDGATFATIFNGDNFVLNRQEALKFKITRDAAVSGTLQVMYYAVNFPLPA